jgi:ABC-type glutathione transport system ATPase component
MDDSQTRRRQTGMGICHFQIACVENRPVVLSIRIENLTKRFGDTIALHSLDLTIGPGEIFFLLGPSGCGKTTLLRSVAGFYPPDEGRIFFGDEDVTELPPHQRNTGMMFQSYALWPHMTVAQNVAFGLEERRVPRAEIGQRVAAALDSVKMGEYAARRINQLSSSASRSPARWSSAPAACCSMSRCRISTRNSASRCAAKSAASARKPGSPPSTSRMIKRRRSASVIASP